MYSLKTKSNIEPLQFDKQTGVEDDSLHVSSKKWCKTNLRNECRQPNVELVGLGTADGQSSRPSITEAWQCFNSMSRA